MVILIDNDIGSRNANLTNAEPKFHTDITHEVMNKVDYDSKAFDEECLFGCKYRLEKFLRSINWSFNIVSVTR